jgi:hypothetical protein
MERDTLPPWPDRWAKTEPTLADVEAEYPDWRPWRAPSGLYYAGRPDTAQVMGEDPSDLRDQIRGWIGRHEA